MRSFRAAERLAKIVVFTFDMNRSVSLARIRETLRNRAVVSETSVGFGSSIFLFLLSFRKNEALRDDKRAALFLGRTIVASIILSIEKKIIKNPSIRVR